MSKITVQRDLCMTPLFTATHDFIPLPPYPPTPPPKPALPLSPGAVAIEPWVNAWYPPGYAMGANKFTTTVVHCGMTICLDGHDCGPLIPHAQLTPAPNNFLSIIHTVMSSRSANFSASTVKMNEESVACMAMCDCPPTPMTYCADPINMPLASAITSRFNSVSVGMTLGDWLAGAVSIAAGMLTDWIMFLWSGGTRGFGQNAGELIAKNRAGVPASGLQISELISELKPDLSSGTGIAKEFFKQGVAALVGAAQVALTGDGSIEVRPELFGPYLSVGVEASTSVDQGWVLGGSANAGMSELSLSTDEVSLKAPLPAGFGYMEGSYEWGQGATATVHETGFDPFFGFYNHTLTVGGPNGGVSFTDGYGSIILENPL